jgi:hypothetical protein
MGIVVRVQLQFKNDKRDIFCHHGESHIDIGKKLWSYLTNLKEENWDTLIENLKKVTW